MANVSYFRQRGGADRSVPRWRRLASRPSRRHSRGRYVLGGGLLLVLVVLAAAAIVVATSDARLTSDASALADVAMPLGGGKVESLVVVGGRDQRPIPVRLTADERIYPDGLVAVDERVTIDVTVRRPGWIAWLGGKTEHLQLTLRTPAAGLRDSYLTLAAGAPLRLDFTSPIAVISDGAVGGALRRHVLAAPQTEVRLKPGAAAGSIDVAAVPRSWERAGASIVSWFPAGTGASAVADPPPGSKLSPSTPITVTFSKPVAAVLGSRRPPVSPAGAGIWLAVNSHTIEFQPQGYGYGLGASVSVGLPAGIRLVGGHRAGSSDTGTWTVPAGSTLRLQQVLSMLGYLPFNFVNTGSGVARTAAAQEVAAIHAPRGTFDWRYGNIPSSLRSIWQPGASGVMTKGAVMAFENDQGITPDGIASPAVWNALIGALLAGHRSSFGYTFVMVSENLPETVNVWHSGRTAVTGPVNTGIPAAPTAQGVFAVFEHALSVTMSGYNPDGSYYSDPGVPYVSYFNGGDALHGFIRASYGYPQSLGCVEMPYSEAAQVYPYTPIGTIVDVS